MRHAFTVTSLTLIATAAAGLSRAGDGAVRPPTPVPYKEIPDPPDDAPRHVAVRAEDRGPVWLYTGFLNNWHPEMDYELIARLKPRHWRCDGWPFWYPVSVTEAGRKGWKTRGNWRDSPALLGRWMDTMMRLQAQGMTWQPVLHHKGRTTGPPTTASMQFPSRAMVSSK